MERGNAQATKHFALRSPSEYTNEILKAFAFHALDGMMM